MNRINSKLALILLFDKSIVNGDCKTVKTVKTVSTSFNLYSWLKLWIMVGLKLQLMLKYEFSSYNLLNPTNQSSENQRKDFSFDNA